MIKKIFLSLLIIFILYILIIFNIPSLWLKIENILWINWFNNFILKSKKTYDETVTNIPTKEEVIETYDTVYSWAVELKNNLKEWLDNTKKQVDNIRETLQETKDNYYELKENINEAKDFIENASWTLKNTINSNTWLIEWTKEIYESIKELENEIYNTWIILESNTGSTNTWSIK